MKIVDARSAPWLDGLYAVIYEYDNGKSRAELVDSLAQAEDLARRAIGRRVPAERADNG